MKDKKDKKIKYTVKGQIPIYNQYGEVIQNAGLVDVTAEHDINWFKIWIADIAGVLRVLGNAKMDIFSYILDNTNRHTNEFGGTVREISEKTSVSKTTVQETINILVEANFMRKIRVATYKINPDIMAYGNSNKRGMLVIQYSNLSEKTPLELEIDNKGAWDKNVKDFEREKVKTGFPVASIGLFLTSAFSLSQIFYPLF